MTNYKSEHALSGGWSTVAPRERDLERTHAANFAMGAGVLAAVLSVIIWCTAKALWPEIPNISILLCAPVAAIFGLSSGSLALIRFTNEVRDALYAMENTTGQDINGDGVVGDPVMQVGTPPEGALIRGVDGQFHRIDTRLSKADTYAIKTSMLSNGTYGVRAINSVLGDETRGSGLRVELHRLGILTKPEQRQATKLTPEGVKAVRRW